MKQENVGYLQIIIAGIIFSVDPIIIRFGEDLGPYNLAFFKVFMAVLILGIFFLIFRKKLVPLKYEKKKMLLFGAIHGFIYLGYFIAIFYLTVASAVLLMYLFPLWMLVFSHFILKEKITKKSLIALLIAFVGALILISPQNFFIRDSLIGTFTGLLSGVGAGLVYVLSKTFEKYDKVSLVFWQNLIALPFLFPLLFFEFPVFNTLNVTIIFVLGAVFLIPFILTFKGLQKVPAHKAGTVMLLEIIGPIVLAFFIFNEIPQLSIIVGGLLIILGVYLAVVGR